MTKLEMLIPNIMVKDVNATLDYYINKLGFKLMDTSPTSGIYEWGYIKLDKVELMFQEEQSLKEEYKQLKSTDIGGGLTFYIRIENIQKYYDEISKNITLVKPMNKTFYNTYEFAIIDLNGHILTFSETPK